MATVTTSDGVRPNYVDGGEGAAVPSLDSALLTFPR